MVSVGFVTGWTDRCGITEYGKHVVQYTTDPEIYIKVLPIPFRDVMQHQPEKYNIIHMNEAGYTMQGFDQGVIDQLRAKNIKTLLTCHTANLKNNKNSLTVLWDKVVVHEKDTEDGFHYIPQGAPVFADRGKVLWNANAVGMCGFPLPWKNYERVAMATNHLKMGFLALIPDSQHASGPAMEARLKSINPRTVTRTDWLRDDEMIQKMATCLATIFPYSNNTPGPSAAAMMGIATGRPVIVSRCSQFQHLFGKEDEFIFIDSADPSIDQIVRAIEKAQFYASANAEKVPTKTYDEMRWDHVGLMYADLYKEMAQPKIKGG